MPDLVTLDEVKAHLRIDDDDFNGALQLLIGAASELVLDFMQAAPGQFVDVQTVPRQVKVAVMVLVGIYSRNPDDLGAGAFEDGRLPPVIRASLRGLRRPVVV